MADGARSSGLYHPSGEAVLTGIVDVASDALGRALSDHLAGTVGPPLRLESDDGNVREADLQPADFFAPPEAWPTWERRGIARVVGRVLDLGAGAGRHSLHVQELGNPVTAVEASPGCVAVCRSRGVRDVRLMDLHDIAYEDRNRELGFHRGHVRLRLHYRGLSTPWWDLLNIAPADVEPVLEGTPWTLEELFGDDDGYAVVLRRS